MARNLLVTKLPSSQGKINGVSVSKEKKLEKVLDFIKIHGAVQTKDIQNLLGISREATQRIYLSHLLKVGKIKKVDGTHKYQLSTDNITKREIVTEILNDSEVFQTVLFQNWNARNHAKAKHDMMIKFAHICLGTYVKGFKMHPDQFTLDNFKEVVKNMVDVILKEKDQNLKEPNWNNRQAIRHAIIYGLGYNLSKVEGIELRISGEKNKPQTADLHITKEQIIETEMILKKEFEHIYFLKFSLNRWFGARPSTLYTIKTSDLKFYDRTVDFVEVKGERFYKKDIIDFAKLQNDPSFKFDSFTHRACTAEVFENKQQKTYTKYCFDGDFVKILEKYVKQRKFEKKKYLFWNDNQTEFTFLNYDGIVVNQVIKDLKQYKRLFLKVGFNREDFGKAFRANYALRHFAIQTWLDYTNYDYDFVGQMFHETTQTLKDWYGKMRAEHLQKKVSEVVA